MAEISLMWSGTTVGDAGPYTDDQFSDMLMHIITYDRARQGVLLSTKTGYTGGLVVSNAGGSTARVASGAALVDGKLYLSNANIDFTVSGASVHWIVGLRKSWVAQTVRAFARGNYASAALALASLVQTDGTTWEIPLATVLTTAGGAVSTVTDARKYIGSGPIKRFVPCVNAWNSTAGAVINPSGDATQDDVYGYPLPDAANAYGYGGIEWPKDYISVLSIEAVVYPTASGNVQATNRAQILSEGASYIARATDTTSAVAVVIDTIAKIQAISPGVYGDDDNMYLEFKRAGGHADDTMAGTLYLLGWEITYTGLIGSLRQYNP